MTLRFLPDPGVLGELGKARAARLLDERTRRMARPGAAPGPVFGSVPGSVPQPTLPALGHLAPPLLLLALGAETYGIPLHRVAEVLPAEPVCPLPGSPPAVLGLRARAGRLHAVLDLAQMLGVQADEAPGGHDVLLRAEVRATGGRRLALRVGRALAAVVPSPLPPDRAPASPGGVIAFHARAQEAGIEDALPGSTAPEAGSLFAVLDLDRLLSPYAALTPSPAPSAHPPGA